MPSDNPRSARHRQATALARGVAKPPKTAAARARHALMVMGGLQRHYPNSVCALRHDGPFQLLVATILSAQCTDKKVNEVTPELFSRWPDARALAVCEVADLERVIHPTGFFRAKAKNLRGMAEVLVRDHDGEVPRDLEALTRLPGVGRKTAHVVLGTAFGIPSGIVVDTHVARLTRRLGLTKATDPAKIEHDLIALLPSGEWIDFSHRLIEHGRGLCPAQRPKCLICPFTELCPRVGVTKVDESATSLKP